MSDLQEFIAFFGLSFALVSGAVLLVIMVTLAIIGTAISLFSGE